MSKTIITKRCCHCKEIKSTSEYHKDRSTRDGLQARCKDCKRTYNQSTRNKAYQKKFSQSKEGKACYKRYRDSEKGKDAISQYRQTDRYKSMIQKSQVKYSHSEKGKAKHRRESAKRRLRYPGKIKANNIVNYAVSSGRLPHPSTLKCSCGKQAKHYHHSDYSKPLNVIPVCIKCHTAIHFPPAISDRLLA